MTQEDKTYGARTDILRESLSRLDSFYSSEEFSNIPDVILREIKVDDAGVYFDAVDSNRDHLSQFRDKTSAKYIDLKSVQDSIQNPDNPLKKRFGIWDNDRFVGSINITPDEKGSAEIGYWLDGRFQGRGYATLALNSLIKLIGKDYENLYAKVHTEICDGTEVANERSVRVLERVGFEQIAKQSGRLIFQLMRRE